MVGVCVRLNTYRHLKMNNPQIEPTIINGGSAFRVNSLNSNHPVERINSSNKVRVVSLSEWCARNFISKRVGRTLIKKKLLIAFRQKHQWWVTANPDCIEQLLEYLGIEKLLFDVEQT